MKKLPRFLTNRWLLAIVGLVVLALLVWFVGGQVSIFGEVPLGSPTARALAIMSMVVAWALLNMRKAFVANRASSNIADGLAASKDSAAANVSAEEARAIQQRFEEAVALLKKAKGKHGRLNLYELPWYVFIGPPGSGKTTALECSGLRFPLKNKLGQRLRGVGGTRNCDFWFTDEAVLLDTAGRFTTQDSQEEADRSAWSTFLDELKSKRPRRPINGVVAAISAHDMLTMSDEELEERAARIKSRIEEFYTRFKIRFPVYVMFTKCDLLAGFTEFFADLDEQQRAQVWGMTFAIDDSDSAEGAAGRFVAQFRALVKRLNDRVLDRLHSESDSKRRAVIYGFPAQFAALEPRIDRFVGQIFRGSAYERPPMLRGVYFSSGTQEGTPIDRLLSTVMHNFGLEAEARQAQVGAGKSYFIKSLLHDVIFGESQVAGTNRRLEAQQAWMQRGLYVGCAALVGVGLLAWTVSYFNNRAYITEVRDTTAAARRAVADVPRGRELGAVLPALDAVRGIPGGFGDREAGTPWLSGFGLSQRKTLGAEATATYTEVLKQLLLPRLMLRLEDQLRTGGTVPDYQYEALKVYLMLDSQSHYDSAQMIRWFEADVNGDAALRLSAAERERLLGHVGVLFAKQPLPLPQALDIALIDQTQRAVARMPLEQRIYGRLKRLDAVTQLPRFSLFDAAGPASQIVFRSSRNAALNEGIDGLFTREGYRTVFVTQSTALSAALIEETWILGSYAPSSLDTVQILGRVKQLYFEEFSQRYRDLLLGLELTPFATPREAIDILNVLSNAAESPLLRLFQSVARETALEAREPAAGGAEGNEQEQSDFGNIIGVGQVGGEPSNLVEQEFKWVAELVAGDPASAPIQHVRSLFEQLYRQMVVVSNVSGGRGEVPQNVANEVRTTVQQVQIEAGRQAPMVAALLESAASGSQSVASGGLAANLNSQWQAGPLQFCRNAILGRYPVSGNSAQEIGLAEFGAFFGTGGSMDQFFTTYLDAYVDRLVSPWEVRRGPGMPNLSMAALRQFERASLIRDTFFRGGGQAPSLVFELKPVGPVEQNFDVFTLVLGSAGAGAGEKRVVYDSGPPIVEYINWPGQPPISEVRIEVNPPAPSGRSMLRQVGPWAWFRALDAGTVRPHRSPDTFELELNLESRRMLYEMVARGGYTPARFAQLQQFTCPQTLL